MPHPDHYRGLKTATLDYPQHGEKKNTERNCLSSKLGVRKLSVAG